MAELPVDGPLGATEKLRCIQEIFDRFSPASPNTRDIQAVDQEIRFLSDAELIAQAQALVRQFTS